METSKFIKFFENESAQQKIKAKNYRDPAHFKSVAYSRIASIIRDSFDANELLTNDKVNKLPITDGMKKKINGFILSGKIPNQSIKKSPKKKSPTKKISQKKLIGDLTNFMGIGTSKAKELVENGLTDIKQIRQKKYLNMLTDQTRVFLSLKPVKRIPHDNIAMLEPLLIKIQKALGKTSAEMIIVGSYRRKTRFSKDIDVMVVSDDKNILNKIIKIFIKKIGKGTTKKPNVAPYIIGPDKVSLIVKNLKTNAKPKGKKETKPEYYKIDMFRTSVASKWAMLLYSTGSKNNNIRMRAIAKKKGWLLNQEGLYVRSTKKLLSDNAKSEKYFFDKLGLEYKEPKDRN